MQVYYNCRSDYLSIIYDNSSQSMIENSLREPKMLLCGKLKVKLFCNRTKRLVVFSLSSSHKNTVEFSQRLNDMWWCHCSEGNGMYTCVYFSVFNFSVLVPSQWHVYVYMCTHTIFYKSFFWIFKTFKRIKGRE